MHMMPKSTSIKMSSQVKMVLMLFIVMMFSECLDNGLGLTPPMGWNSWNKFGCNFN